MVKHFVQSNGGVVPCVIVQPEVLKVDNYEKWRIFMQHYLVAQDLWDVVLSSEMADGEDPREWIKKNAFALYAIKISCGAEMFDQVKEINSAKDAWNALADLHKQPNEDGNEDTGFEILERKQTVTLLKDIEKEDSDAVNELLETPSSYSARVLEDGSTLLHVAIVAGQVELAKRLISVTSEEGLEIPNKRGMTALSLAACKGSRQIVECLVGKNGRLLEIPDCEKKIPLVLACATHHLCLTRYLYSVTPIKILDPVNGDHGFFLLKECLRNHMIEMGLDLLRKFPDLIFHKSSLEPTPIISELVQMLSSLFAGWEWRFCWLRASKLEYDRAHAREMVHFICYKLSTLERDQLIGSGAVEATFKAIKLGYLDFVKQITEANPDIVWSHDPEHSRDMLMYAVAHRQKEIAEFLYGLNAWRSMTRFATDDDQNNMLHLAAKLSPSSPCIHHFPDPVLHMQSEAWWFMAIADIVPAFYEEQRNKDGETPSEMFRREHQNLLKEGQRWVKETANFAAIIGTLIVSIMFAAGITVPGVASS
ncbi:hypothetical protein SLEP1_g42700 [Rubroshorea leprosula]|uniref:DUF4219 domain-containing protein n=1 Tax=Rubroshorea leprosula TaxID=152421 RepID=A0AAV5LB38_9ROSI|nr:hypothetical protein SLEP1_g42700 [Rubroshorea leprosula]